MESFANATVACLHEFSQLLEGLQNPEHCRLMPLEKVEAEYDRFKIWSGNLGAMQSGSSSLDYRLRGSTVMRANVFKLLSRLKQTLKKSECNRLISSNRQNAVPLHEAHVQLDGRLSHKLLLFYEY